MTTVDRSHAPRTGQQASGIPHSSPESLLSTVGAAADAAEELAGTAPATRRRWLIALADALEANAEGLIALADDETALGAPRLRGELAKTAANARYYGAVGEAGTWMRARVERPGDAGGPDLRRANLPVGPVAVFGASNFPFQFGTVGHDTCSALAAGCPVLVKAHPAHPRLAAALAEVATHALRLEGAPVGAFASVVGFDAGLALVDAPQVKAVAFTGSQAGGMALLERANRRPSPIPVFAEMGTVNPAVLTTAGLARLATVATGFVESFTLGTGQFCTKPGLLLAPRGAGVAEAVADAVGPHPGGWMLTASIADAYRDGLAGLERAGARLLRRGPEPDAGFRAGAAVLTVDADLLQPGSRLLQECFGPVALVAEYDGVDHAIGVLGQLQPALAASVFGGESDDPDVAPLVAALAGQTGRVVVDGWPTGVACSDAMQHGGPWPATSRPDATSVGAEALSRFTRPVAFQNVPDAALPLALQDANPWGLTGRSDQRAAP